MPDNCGPKWTGSRFELRLGCCSISCHFIMILIINIISSILILTTQGVYIYYKYPTFALGGFIGPFMDIQAFKRDSNSTKNDILLIFVIISMWRLRQSVPLLRLQFALSVLTIISSGSLFVIDCALLSIYILNSATIFFAALLLIELVSSIFLFSSTMPFLVGGNWANSIIQDETANTQCSENWIVRNHVQPGLRILDVDEIAERNRNCIEARSQLRSILRRSNNPCTVSADDSFRFCYRPFDMPPTYKDLYPKTKADIMKSAYGVHV